MNKQTMKYPVFFDSIEPIVLQDGSDRIPWLGRKRNN